MKNLRKHLRYEVDPVDQTMARFERLGMPSACRLVLVADESHSGCRVITIGRLEEVEVGETTHLVFGSIHSEAEVKRVEMFEPLVLSLGCEYIGYPTTPQKSIPAMQSLK